MLPPPPWLLPALTREPLLRERRCVAEHACVAPNVKSESAPKRACDCTSGEALRFGARRHQEQVPFRGDPIADASMRSESSAYRGKLALV